MLNITEWSEMHCELNLIENDICSKRTDTVNWFINDNVDYEILIESTLFEDGSFDHEILESHIIHIDDAGNIVSSTSAKLPKRFEKSAMETMEERLS